MFLFPRWKSSVRVGTLEATFLLWVASSGRTALFRVVIATIAVLVFPAWEWVRLFRGFW